MGERGGGSEKEIGKEKERRKSMTDQKISSKIYILGPRGTDYKLSIFFSAT